LSRFFAERIVEKMVTLTQNAAENEQKLIMKIANWRKSSKMAIITLTPVGNLECFANTKNKHIDMDLP
jgi:ethanolamine utilization microcompartment shell protein EutS